MRTAGFLLLLLAACGDDAGSREPAQNGPAPLDIPKDAPLVVFLGDSISAGLHLPADESFPAVAQRMLFERGKPFRMLNAGQSGDTSAGGLRRVAWILKQKPAIVVVELGGNDGLRGQAIESIRTNLEGILAAIEKAGAKTLLLGMRMPTSYGADYTAAYARIFDELAQANQVAYVPFFMEPIAGKPDFFLEDELHPNAEGHKLLAEKIVPALEKLLG
ncbi:MAG: arylesterase [Planctomycetota bacterium]|jgi:acyl-CoA thioesterase-1